MASVAVALALPSLTSSSVSGSGATLTLSSEHSGSWYYKATTAPHTTCQGPVSTRSVTLSGLNSGTSYTYSAYSDSTCTAANLVATAAAFTTSLNAPSNLTWNLNYPHGINISWSNPTGSGSVSYDVECKTGTNTNWHSCGTIAATTASTVTHTFNNTLTIKFRVRAKSGSATSAWAEYVSP